MKLLRYFTKWEWMLWGVSVCLIVSAFLLSGDASPMMPLALLVGVTSLILCAKGNPWGQVLMVLFSLLYGAISYSFAYYGEMITYLGMTAPMSVVALISWLRHPHRGNRAEVEVNRLSERGLWLMALLTVAVTVLFYPVLKHLGTSNLLPGTLSVTTSFLAVYLIFRRSPYYALAYAANDVLLVLLWVLATLENFSYVSVVICFLVFLVNDLYGFFCWQRMQKRQESEVV